jgi:hypothetical protein
VAKLSRTAEGISSATKRRTVQDLCALWLGGSPPL